MALGARTLAFIGLLLAAPAAAVRAAPPLPEEWHAVSSAPEDQTIQLMVALKQKNLDKLAETALEVSDPRSTSYKHYLSNEDIQAMTAP
eukprot:SAG31_NODE_16781_length_696_cov_1.117253_1_plen_88_part_01